MINTCVNNLTVDHIGKLPEAMGGMFYLASSGEQDILVTELNNPIVIRSFNVKYSPNLGDGLLSECLEYGLISLGASQKSGSIDLAGRNAYGDAMVGRGTIMAVLDALPKVLRNLVVRLPLAVQAARKWRPAYRAGLVDADAVAIGGGNLITDIDLNFSTKLSLAIAESAGRGLPCAIYACGMAGDWTQTGLRQCRKAFSNPNLKAVFLRDVESIALWDKLMAPYTGQTAQLARDPGLIASDLYPAPPRPVRDRPVAGIGIMSPIAIRYHSDQDMQEDALEKWYIGLTRALVADGFQVHIFTNGSPEDKIYCDKMHDALLEVGREDDIRFVTQTNPKELCANISAFDVLIAYRMHAIIAAYSYGIPAIAMAWDRKLQSFMSSVERVEWLVNPDKTTPEECAKSARLAVTQGLPMDTHARVLSEARADIARLWSVLSNATDQT